MVSAAHIFVENKMQLFTSHQSTELGENDIVMKKDICMHVDEDI